MVDALQWRDPGAAAAVEDAHLDLLARRLGETLLAAKAEQPALAEEVRRQMQGMPDDAFMRVLIAPETGYHLLSDRSAGPAAACRHLQDSCAAERLREGVDPAADRRLWTALGDFGFAPGRGAMAWPQLAGGPPLDFGSPHAAHVDLTGADRKDLPPRPDFTAEEATLVFRRIEGALRQIEATAPAVGRFVAGFNKVVVLQKDPEAPGSFASGSNGHFIGRTFLANPHLPELDDSLVADALVHEAIHALLYMQELQEPWFPEPGVKRSLPRVASPWTGSLLPFPSYLQACFVWYGLLHFWSLALRAGTFRSELVHRRLGTALGGFLGRLLRARVADHAPAVARAVLDAVDEMQAVVAGSFATVTAAR
jgi:hypothetical protein